MATTGGRKKREEGDAPGRPDGTIETAGISKHDGGRSGKKKDGTPGRGPSS
jgi:hypothetical protein